MKTLYWIIFIIFLFIAGFLIIVCLDRFNRNTEPTMTRDQAFDSAVINVHKSMQQAAIDQLDSFYYYSGKSDAYFEIRKLLK